MLRGIIACKVRVVNFQFSLDTNCLNTSTQSTRNPINQLGGHRGNGALRYEAQYDVQIIHSTI
jgi:hypothetical protein